MFRCKNGDDGRNSSPAPDTQKEDPAQSIVSREGARLSSSCHDNQGGDQ